MENLDWGVILTLILGALGTFVSGAWVIVKNKLGKVVKLVKESYEAIDAIETSLSDDKITKDEIKNIKSQLNDVKVSFNDLIAKK